MKVHAPRFCTVCGAKLSRRRLARSAVATTCSVDCTARRDRKHKRLSLDPDAGRITPRHEMFESLGHGCRRKIHETT